MTTVKIWRLSSVGLWFFVLFVMDTSGHAPKIITEISVDQKFRSTSAWVDETVFFAIQAQVSDVSTDLRYLWFRDDVLMKNTTLNFFTIQTAHLSDSGTYHCLVHNGAGQVRSVSFNLTVKEFTDFSRGVKQPILVQEGNFTILNLLQHNFDVDMVRVHWKKEPDTYIHDNYHYYKSLSASLVLIDVPLSTAGERFQADIKQMRGTRKITPTFAMAVSASPSQDVFAAPTFILKPENISTVVNTPGVSFECVINSQNGESNLVISWFRRSPTASAASLINNNKYQIWPLGRRLKIKNVQLNDAGIYLCQGSRTGYLSIEAQFTLTAIDPPKIVTMPPGEIFRDFQQSLVLPCDVTGSEPLVRNWYFNGAKMELSGQRHQTHANGTLEITSVDSPDSGVYQCFGRNEGGEVYTYTYLRVNNVPCKSCIIGLDMSVSVHNGGSIKLTLGTWFPQLVTLGLLLSPLMFM